MINRLGVLLAVAIIIWPAPARAVPCEVYANIKAGDVSPCEGVRIPTEELAYLLAAETRADTLAAELRKLKADNTVLKAEVAAANRIATSERLSRIACFANAVEVAKCDTPWGGWPWVTGIVGLAVGGLAGYGVAEVTR